MIDTFERALPCERTIKNKCLEQGCSFYEPIKFKPFNWLIINRKVNMRDSIELFSSRKEIQHPNFFHQMICGGLLTYYCLNIWD